MVDNPMETLIIGVLAFSLLVIFPVYALYDLLQFRFKGKNTKTIWIIVIFATSFIGASCYFLFGRRKRILEKN